MSFTVPAAVRELLALSRERYCPVDGVLPAAGAVGTAGALGVVVVVAGAAGAVGAAGAAGAAGAGCASAEVGTFARPR
jgi:hypothetical protein